MGGTTPPSKEIGKGVSTRRSQRVVELRETVPGLQLFYMKDYQGSIDAFGKCIEALPKGESLGMFDKAYLQKAEAALEEQSASLSIGNKLLVHLSCVVRLFVSYALPISVRRLASRTAQTNFCCSSNKSLSSCVVGTYEELMMLSTPCALACTVNERCHESFSRSSLSMGNATRAGEPITDATALRLTIAMLEKTGVFDNALDEWRRKPTADQTLANFKTHLATENRERLTVASKIS